MPRSVGARATAAVFGMAGALGEVGMSVEIAGVLAKLLFSGLTGYLGAKREGFDEGDLAALQGVFDAVTQATPLLRESPAPRWRALHFATVTRAFGAALQAHWAHSEQMVPWPRSGLLSRLFQDRRSAERSQELEVRLRFATVWCKEVLEATGADVHPIPLDESTASPTSLVYYRALWTAFTHRSLDEGQQIPMMLFEGDGKLRFETAFIIAYAGELSSPGAATLRAHLFASTAERVLAFRRLVLCDTAAWRSRPVFDTDSSAAIPALPLEDIYVEPLGTDARASGLGARPIRSLIHEALAARRVVVVRGDFGLGKSLTAKIITSDWAAHYLTNYGTPSNDLVYPIYIKCARDFTGRDMTLDALARSALRRQAEELGLALRSDDSALQLPAADALVVFIVDGLDEVHLSQRELDRFFAMLDEATHQNHRVVLMSRAAGLPPPERLPRVPILDVQPFRPFGPDGAPGGDVELWLNRWNRLTGAQLTAREFARADILDICSTPIVLFMAAASWSESVRGSTSRADIYERFMAQVARGKCESDRDAHPVVAAATERIRERLIAAREVPQASPTALSMLWLMSRVAWEAHRLEGADMDVSVFDIEKIVNEELGLREPMMSEIVRVGLLLALQMDPHGDNHRVLFGHKSFREFLVARYWSSTLQKVIADPRGRAKLERRFFGGRLFVDGDESFSFLVQILNGIGWARSQRIELLKWAENVFRADAPAFDEASSARWWEEDRFSVREAALALAGRVTLGAEPLGMELRDEAALRSLIAALFVTQASPGLQAPRMKLQRGQLRGAWLERANLFRADLEGANLEGGNLERANLRGANLRSARLTRANLFMADLQNADLTGASLIGARLQRASLKGAVLSSARLDGAILDSADLDDANLDKASLEGASINHARLNDASLEGAHLERALLREARLQGVRAKGANFFKAQLHSADLRHSDLRGSNLAQVSASIPFKVA